LSRPFAKDEGACSSAHERLLSIDDQVVNLGPFLT